MSHAIQIDHLSRHFGRTEAVRDLTFGVPQGTIYAFLGPNGAAQTMTIKVLINLLDRARPCSERTPPNYNRRI